MRYRVVISMICAVLFIQTGYADEVHLKNGDRLTGKIVQLVGGKMLLKSAVAGEVTVAQSDIETFSSDEPIEVHLKDSTTFHHKVSSAAAGHFSLATGDLLKSQEFSISDVVSINPPPKPVPRWTGDISLGLTSTHGNTKIETINASVGLAKRTDNDRTTINFDYARSKQENRDTGEIQTTEDWWRAKGKYDYFFSKKMYGYVNGRYEKDAVAELDRRMIIGGGGGYQWIESSDMNFSTEFGLATLYEKYTNETDSKSELSLELGYHFDKKLNKIASLTHDLTYYPSTDKFSDYFLTSSVGIRADLTERMFASFRTLFQYDATPAIGAGSTDVKYFLNLGYRF
jgi:putative salt-induced outer membrane protein YdiY